MKPAARLFIVHLTAEHAPLHEGQHDDGQGEDGGHGAAVAPSPVFEGAVDVYGEALRGVAGTAAVTRERVEGVEGLEGPNEPDHEEEEERRRQHRNDDMARALKPSRAVDAGGIV